MYLLLRGISPPPSRALLCAAVLAKVMKLHRNWDKANQPPPRVTTGYMTSVWSLCGTARKVTYLCQLLGHSSIESSISGVHEEEAGAGAVVLRKQQQSTSKTTGVGHILVEVGRTGQEKYVPLFFCKTLRDLRQVTLCLMRSNSFRCQPAPQFHGC